MNMFRGADMAMAAKSFAVECLRMYRHHYLNPSIAMRVDVDVQSGIAREIHYGTEMALTWFAHLATGETTIEDVSHEFEFKFPVFETWWDHLKYDLQQRRVLGWLPALTTKRLRVRYVDVVKKSSRTVPTKVVRACPHALVDFSKGSHYHLAYLFPSQFNQCSRCGEPIMKEQA